MKHTRKDKVPMAVKNHLLVGLSFWNSNLAGATDVWDVCTNVNLIHSWDIMVRQFSRACKDFWTINDWYNGANIVNLPLEVVEIWFVLNIKHWLPVWTNWGHLFVNIFWQLTISTMVQKVLIYHLRLLR